MNTAPIANASILIKPSDKLCAYLGSLEASTDMPLGILDITSKSCSNSNINRPMNSKYLLNIEDQDIINDLNFSKESRTCTILLNLEDLNWLFKEIVESNKSRNEKVYFHELFEGCKVVLPKNKQVPRNPELEKRCNILKAQQENRQYKLMTKNVDSVRKNHPEDTVSYQVKQINKHLIAIAQFIISVIAGFAFGFIGIELLIGNLDFGFRLLLGIICALIIALAELYFLAKKLNEDLNYEMKVEENTQKMKLQ